MKVCVVRASAINRMTTDAPPRAIGMAAGVTDMTDMKIVLAWLVLVGMAETVTTEEGTVVIVMKTPGVSVARHRAVVVVVVAGATGDSVLLCDFCNSSVAAVY